MLEDEGGAFYVSYAPNDVAWAEWISWQLEEAGLSVTLEAWDFLPGGNSVALSDRALATARCTIAVFSRNYQKYSLASSQWQSAWHRAQADESTRLLLARIDDIEVTGVLEQSIPVNLFAAASPSEARSLLLAAVQGNRRKPAVEPVFPGGVEPIFPGRLREPSLRAVAGASPDLVRVAVVDAHDANRHGIAAAISQDARIVVSAAHESTAALARSGAHFDICVIGYMSGAPDKGIQHDLGGRPVVVLSLAQGWQYQVGTWLQGARAIIDTRIGGLQIAELVCAAADGDLIDSRIARALLTAIEFFEIIPDPRLEQILARCAQNTRLRQVLDALGVDAGEFQQKLTSLRRELGSAHRWTYPHDTVEPDATLGPASSFGQVAPVSLPAEILAVTGLQRELLEQLADGYTEQEIADAHGLSSVDVRRQFQQAMQRLGIPHDDEVSHLWCALYLFGRHRYPDRARRRVSMHRAELISSPSRRATLLPRELGTEA
ncbi:TIR domain-containing protein [Frankia sp. AgB1.9]|uniref:TIR domain-containing protein n=1 Tax=unclassified Frankia TaxID=2632575 RepID=UPI001931CE98|nr:MULTISPECIES: TIR domain-containing protein [unclassified Frankia]MBL7490810.1 TIR domain-containing protein [Frankia sp. AgW1.1]MBL7552233.1 TIR domain-containing protein [Frankia sp. AgB1.9]MBL7622008.1 TIR domain-containing protein [Frankia sp. AgB1.8]